MSKRIMSECFVKCVQKKIFMSECVNLFYLVHQLYNILNEKPQSVAFESYTTRGQCWTTEALFIYISV